jgi:hypothetical protein
MPAQTVIKLRRGTASAWTSANPVLAAGEMGVETDTNKSKYGDGATAWNSLAYSVATSSGGAAVDWNDVLNKPSTFSPSAHTHVLVDVTDVTATAAELNVLDGITASTAELNLLDGVTASTAELNYVDGVTSAIQTQIDGKAAAVHTHIVADITDLTATATELNVLDGITATVTELNYTDGVTSSIQTQLNEKAPLAQTVDNKTASYTILAGDNGKVIRSTSTAITLTIANVLSIGQRIDFLQDGTGQITFAAGSGVTLRSVDNKLKTNKQYSGVTVICTASGIYHLIGDLAA